MILLLLYFTSDSLETHSVITPQPWKVPSQLRPWPYPPASGSVPRDQPVYPPKTGYVTSSSTSAGHRMLCTLDKLWCKRVRPKRGRWVVDCTLYPLHCWCSQSLIWGDYITHRQRCTQVTVIRIIDLQIFDLWLDLPRIWQRHSDLWFDLHPDKTWLDLTCNLAVIWFDSNHFQVTESP